MPINTIGFIGLGVMGEAMCRNLARHGAWTVLGVDTRTARLERLASEGVEAASLPDACARAEVLITCLPGDYEVEAISQGPDGLLAQCRKGQIVIDMSISPTRRSRRHGRPPLPMRRPRRSRIWRCGSTI